MSWQQLSRKLIYFFQLVTQDTVLFMLKTPFPYYRNQHIGVRQMVPKSFISTIFESFKHPMVLLSKCELPEGKRNFIYFDLSFRVVRPSHQWLLKTSSRNSSATLTTPQIHCTASLSQNSHLFVRLTKECAIVVCMKL